MTDVENKQVLFIKALMKKHASSMVQLTYRRTCDWQLSEDLVQETFLTACCKPDQVCNHAKPVAWLYDVLNKLTMRELDRAYRTAEVSVEEHPLLVEETVAPETLPDTKPSRRPSRRGSGLRILRVAEVAAAVVLCLVVTANAFGVNPIQAFFSWAEGVIQVYSDPSGIMELPADDLSKYHSLEEALTANGIDASGCPTWVPRDYSLCNVWVRATDGIIKCTASYESTRGELIMRVTQNSMDSTASTEEREDDGYEYTNDNGTYYIVSNYELSKVGWQIGSTSYVISGQVSEEEIVKIINSIIMRS